MGRNDLYVLSPNVGDDRDERPLLVAIDHPHAISLLDFGEFVLPSLLAPIAEGQVPNIQLLVVASNERLRELSSTDRFAQQAQVQFEVHGFKSSQVPRLVRRYLALRNQPLPKPELLVGLESVMEKEQGAHRHRVAYGAGIRRQLGSGIPVLLSFS